jgi:phosphoglycerate dehydrogenase-like enzyme
MVKAKVVFIAHVDTEFKDVFVENCPSNMEVVRAFSNPKATEKEVADEFGSEQLRDADFLVLFCRWRVPEEAVRGARRLKFIQTLGQGTEHIPVRIASEMGIPVSNSGGGNAISVAEHTVLLMLATLKNLLQGVEAIRQDKFTKDMDRRSFHHLYEKTVGIIGLGTIGRLVAKLVNGFGVNVIFFDPADIPQSVVTDCHARRVSLEELLSISDVVSLHVPLLKSTKGMLRWEQLSMMKPSAVFINTSRGDLVDELALIRALREKVIAGAGLDVFDQEPPSRDNPLLNMENVVPTPHIAGMSSENWVFRVKNCWENLQRVWNGEKPQSLVTHW